MCEHSFVQRLLRMQDTEKILYRKETKLSKSTIKFIIALNKLEKTVRHQAETATERQRLKQLEVANRQLLSLLKNEKAVIEKCKKDIIQMQDDYQQITTEVLEEEKRKSGLRERLNALQQLSNIFINEKALPDLVQGMVICEQQEDRHWIPFRFSTEGVDVQQICETLWGLSQNTELYNQQWAQLICGTQQPCSKIE